MSRKHQQEIKRLTQKIVENYRPQKIILFGSFAWGRPTKDSDIDFFVLKKTAKSRRERHLEVGKILLDRKLPLDVLVYTPQEVRERLRLGDFFVKNIIEKGKSLYVESKL